MVESLIFVVAQSAANNAFDISSFVSLVTPVGVVLMFVLGRIRKGSDYEEERAAREASDKFLQEQVIPLMSRTLETLKTTADSLKAAADGVDKLSSLLPEVKNDRDRMMRELSDLVRDSRK